MGTDRDRAAETAEKLFATDLNAPPFCWAVNGPLPDPNSRSKLMFTGEPYILHLNCFDLFGQLTVFQHVRWFNIC
jgi:hypothetical protein